MNAICLVIDRLHAGFVGAYGNTWVQTPQLDRLAAESFLLDQALIDSPDLASLYRSYWQGWPAIRRRCPPEDRPNLAELLGRVDVDCTLLTDEPAVARAGAVAGFDDLVEIDPLENTDPVDSIDQTHTAHCFARIVDRLDEYRGPFLAWCHLSGLGGPWDAPPEFRQAYVEEGDPPPRASAEVPCIRLPSDYDPDELLTITQAYAGQVSLLDTCVGALLEYLHESGLGAQTLLVLLSARGFPLGEHLRVGPCDEPLYGELVHVPWMMRFPDQMGATVRSQALVEPSDLWATMLDWWNVADLPDSPAGQSLLPLARGQLDAVRDRLLVVADGLQQAIRTPAWYMRDTAGVDEAPGAELFVKPDDRYEVNDVADRCRDVVEQLREVFIGSGRVLQAGCERDLSPLEGVLVDGVE